EARYFSIGRIADDQLADYCRKRGISEEEGRRLLGL
ncbi:MAG: 5-methyltetrahydrofolate--homocysteine methyltransferase, partial [Odoribacter sp.]|nr:5-methyltetrahydrofolate--homocysteine methyltransferase [Odoribacter sp.]